MSGKKDCKKQSALKANIPAVQRETKDALVYHISRPDGEFVHLHSVGNQWQMGTTTGCYHIIHMSIKSSAYYHLSNILFEVQFMQPGSYPNAFGSEYKQFRIWSLHCLWAEWCNQPHNNDGCIIRTYVLIYMYVHVHSILADRIASRSVSFPPAQSPNWPHWR